MGRKRKNLTEEEEVEAKKQKVEKRREYQRKYYEKKKKERLERLSVISVANSHTNNDHVNNQEAYHYHINNIVNHDHCYYRKDCHDQQVLNIDTINHDHCYHRGDFNQRQDQTLNINEFNVLSVDHDDLNLDHDDLNLHENYYYNYHDDSYNNDWHVNADFYFNNNVVSEQVIYPEDVQQFQPHYVDTTNLNATFQSHHEHNIFTGFNKNNLNAFVKSQNVNVTQNDLNAPEQQIHERYTFSVQDHIYTKRKNTLEPSITENYLGEMNVRCIHCNAKHFPDERVSNKGNSFNDCCNHGKVLIPNNGDFPNELKQLFNLEHELSTQFFEHIRWYNNLFSFASFNANIFNFNNGRPAPYCFKIQGQIYYKINTALHPTNNEKPSYGQLFVIDANEAIEHRMENNNKINQSIIELIENVMREHNVFAKSYEMMGEELKKQDLNSPQELQLLFSLKPGTDKRRYNFQRTNEVAAIFSTTADGEIPDAYVVIRNKNTKELQTVSTMDPNVEPWVYPLFYPTGSQGWHRDLYKNDGKKRISRSAYIKNKIAIRDEFNPFIRGRRLFQQFAVDSYVKIEKDRIEYCKSHQPELRVSSYKGLMDFLQNRANGSENLRVGKIVILPSTFIGSPRYMLQCYHDSMAIQQKKGKFDLFITMTCNPRWREIEDNLLQGQQASDRPDICTRVFHLKKNALLDFIVKQKYFGKVIAYIYVIEFQKRGLPHCHLLIKLSPESKIDTVEKVDKYISAEIPDPQLNPDLHNIVMKNMIHGPCGDWCMVDGKCSKKFPKEFQEETIINENSYPIYRRRDTGKTYMRPNNYEVDNRFVVPYCPELSLRFNCHINVEICSSIKSVKYLHKYLYKGHDAASVVITNTTDTSVIEHDEITQFIDSRYVGPVEAIWRILSKLLQDKSHVVVRLPLHLPDCHNITVHTDSNQEAINNALNQISMLIDYFQLNCRDPEARKYYYSDIPEHYVFKTTKYNGKTESKWYKRQKNVNCIGRMYTVSPSQVELFHLRILLLRVKGATSFENLRTVNGEIKETFTAACLAHGFIESDEEWSNAMNEAVVFMMPKQLRRLFVRILIHCNPIHPDKLWEDFKDPMSEDYVRNFSKNESYCKAIIDIQSILQMEGKNLNQFPQLNQLTQIIDNYDVIPTEIEDINNYLSIAQDRINKLNDKQKEVIDKILNAVFNQQHNNENNCFYIDGPGGSGKTFLYETLWYFLKGSNKKVCSMAFTGIAATLLPQGKTVHKIFKLPVPLFSDSSSSIKLESHEATFLKDIDVFIWDEAPMAPRFAIEVMDRTLRDIMNNDSAFGGKIVVLGGDFRQLLPVKLRGTRSETVDLSLNRCIHWSKFLKFSLTQNMRALPEEIEFSKFLLNVGDGKLNDAYDNLSIDHFPPNCIAAFDVDIVKDIYGEIFENKQYRKSINYAILSARNADVNEINEKVVNLLDEATEKIYTSIDSTENCDNSGFDEILLTEYLNTLYPPSLPPYELKLRINCIVMLIRNLNISEGLCNGTRLLILNLTNNLLKCEILTGDKRGQIIFLNRITLYSSESDYPFIFKRRQFPIKLAFAMTINKAQGQTFEKIGIDLTKDVFNHGQLYVALSRVRSWGSFKIYLGCSDRRSIKNYVYKELYV